MGRRLFPPEPCKTPPWKATLGVHLAPALDHAHVGGETDKGQQGPCSQSQLEASLAGYWHPQPPPPPLEATALLSAGLALRDASQARLRPRSRGPGPVLECLGPPRPRADSERPMPVPWLQTPH